MSYLSWGRYICHYFNDKFFLSLQAPGLSKLSDF